MKKPPKGGFFVLSPLLGSENQSMYPSERIEYDIERQPHSCFAAVFPAARLKCILLSVLRDFLVECAVGALYAV